MKSNSLSIFLDPETKFSLLLADATKAASDLANAHLSGPAANFYLAQALAACSLLRGEMSQEGETALFRCDCPEGELKGFMAEVSLDGTLRGTTSKKIIDKYDGTGKYPEKGMFGKKALFGVVKSIPGSVISSGAVESAPPSVASGLEQYFTESLQRRVCVAAVASVDDDASVLFARAALIECPPDGDKSVFEKVAAVFKANAAKALAAAAPTSGRPAALLGKLGLPHASMRDDIPLAFGCWCSAERARDTLMSLPESELASIIAEARPVDVTCHLCGRTWTVPPEALKTAR